MINLTSNGLSVPVECVPDANTIIQWCNGLITTSTHKLTLLNQCYQVALFICALILIWREWQHYKEVKRLKNENNKIPN